MSMIFTIPIFLLYRIIMGTNYKYYDNKKFIKSKVKFTPYKKIYKSENKNFQRYRNKNYIRKNL